MFFALDVGPSKTAERSRERQLWCAVIGRAVQDALQSPGPVGRTTEQARHWEAARRWFADNDSFFRWACESAGFDPDYLRERVLRRLGGDATAAPAVAANNFRVRRYEQQTETKPRG